MTTPLPENASAGAFERSDSATQDQILAQAPRPDALKLLARFDREGVSNSLETLDSRSFLPPTSDPIIYRGVQLVWGRSSPARMAARFAGHVLPFFEAFSPDDVRPRRAIEAAAAVAAAWEPSTPPLEESVAAPQSPYKFALENVEGAAFDAGKYSGIKKAAAAAAAAYSAGYAASAASDLMIRGPILRMASFAEAYALLSSSAAADHGSGDQDSHCQEQSWQLAQVVDALLDVERSPERFIHPFNVFVPLGFEIAIPGTLFTIHKAGYNDVENEPFHQIACGTMTADEILEQWPIAKGWLLGKGWKEYPLIKILNSDSLLGESTVTGWRMDVAGS